MIDMLSLITPTTLVSAAAFLSIVVYCVISNTNRKRSRRILSTIGLDGKLIYIDNNKLSRTFFSKEYSIAAKPDFIIKLRSGKIATLEYKSRSNGRLYDSDIAQVKATALAVRSKMPVDEAYVYAGNKLHYISLKKNNTLLFNEIKEYVEYARRAKSGEIVSVFAKNPNQCNKCASRSICRKPQMSQMDHPHNLPLYLRNQKQKA